MRIPKKRTAHKIQKEINCSEVLVARAREERLQQKFKNYTNLESCTKDLTHKQANLPRTH
jgi:hypothetical protein